MSLIRRRKPGRWPLALGVVIAAALLGIVAIMAVARPVVTAVAPEADASGLSTRALVRLAFNQPMNPDSVAAAVSIDPPVAGAWTWDEARQNAHFLPSAPWAEHITVTVALNGGQAANGLPLLERRTWSFGIGGERVLFLYGLDAVIASVEADSRLPLDKVEPDILAREPNGILEFDVSPEGGTIVYAAPRADDGADLKLVNVDGSEPRLLLACPDESCRRPVFSPDGARVAFERQTVTTDAAGQATFGEPHVEVLALATGIPLALSAAGGETRDPNWSTIGQLVVYDPGRQAFVVLDPALGSPTYVPALSGQFGDIAPDGRTLVFPEIYAPITTTATISTETLYASPFSFFSRLQAVALDTNATVNLSGDQVVEDTAPLYAPGGQWLVFARRGLETGTWTPGRQLWRMRPDGSEALALTDDPVAYHSAVRWSPDGTRLVYMRTDSSDPSRAPEIWICNADGSDSHAVVSGGFGPEWLP